MIFFIYLDDSFSLQQQIATQNDNVTIDNNDDDDDDNDDDDDDTALIHVDQSFVDDDLPEPQQLELEEDLALLSGVSSVYDDDDEQENNDIL
jgi:hypothetical protein